MSTAKFVFQGVDYLRLTANDHRPYGDWHGLLLPEFLQEEHAGRRKHNRWLLTYWGQVGEHCFVGQNDAGCMVQVSSNLADTLFRPLSHAGGRCSRIDVQITSEPPEGPDEYLHSAFNALKASEKLRGRPQQVQMIDSNNGAKMVTIGARQSQVYARIYDKGRESKQEEWNGYVRHELECKEETARDLHSWLLGDVTRVHTIKAIVGNYFEKRGCPMFWDELESKSMPDSVKRTRTDESKLAWLATQVSPTLRVLVQRGKALEAAKALLTGVEDNAIIDAVAEALARIVHS